MTAVRVATSTAGWEMNGSGQKAWSRLTAWFSLKDSTPSEIEDSRKRVLMDSTALAAVVLLVSFGVVTFRSGDRENAWVDFGVAALIVGLRVVTHATGRLGATSLAGVIALSGLFAFLFAQGGPGGSGPLWSFSFPLFSLYLLGRGIGSAVCMGHVAVLAVILALPRALVPHAPTDPTYLTRYFAVFALVWFIAYLFEHVRSRQHRRMLAENSRLQAAITEQASIQQALNISEQRLRDITMSTSDIVWETDAHGVLTFAGGRLEDALGYGEKELLGKSLFGLVVEEQQDDVRRRFNKAAGRAGQLRIPECWIHHRDRRRVCLEFNGVPALNATGGLAGYRGVGKDISLQKRAEEERARIEESLRTAQKMEAVGQLAGGIAHDFNNILGSISGYAEMISKRVGDSEPKVKKYADTILSASSRAADLTSKLLTFARKGRFQNVLFNLHHSIRELSDLLRLTIDKRIAIVINTNAANPMVHGDPTQVSNALLNLALNARDAMPEGGRLVFETSNIVADDVFKRAHAFDIVPGEYLCISVSDTGSGMDEKTKARVFEPFFTTKDVGKGTGLGLASVYGTVKTHKGFISVYSEVGVGTTIKIYLPSAKQTAAEPAERPLMAKDGIPELVHGTGTVMVIDDEKFLLELSREVLEKLGYSPRTFQVAAEGLAWYQDHWREVDLVIVDMIMPGTNGRECLRSIKTINPDAKVILSTGFNLDVDAPDLLKEGFLGVLQKPFVMGALSQAVARALGIVKG